MKSEQKPTARSGYVAIFIVSWVIPVMHILLLDEALERTRYFTGLMPGIFLFLKWFGQLSWFGPILIAVTFGLSWKYPGLASPESIAKILIWLYVLTVVYAVYCGFLFSITLYGT